MTRDWGEFPADKGTGKASHFSEGKPGVDQIPPEVLMEWGSVFTYGERKYGRDNWKKGTEWHEFYGSVLRHLFRWWAGEEIDPETGLPHLAHALWNVGALRFYQLYGIGDDDRVAWMSQQIEAASLKAPFDYSKIEWVEANLWGEEEQ